MEAQKSLQIIENMILRTQNNMYRNRPFFLLWGISVFICAITHFILLKLNVADSENIWLALPIIALIHIAIAIKQHKEREVKTYSESAINALWTALGFAFLVLGVFAVFTYEGILPIFILLYGIGTYTTGKIIAFKPLYLGGLICFALSMISNFVSGEYQLLIIALAILISYIIPALMLKNKFTALL